MQPTLSAPGATPLIAERHHLIEMDGSTLYVLDAGRGEVVLLGHSYLWNAEMWRP